MLYQAEGNRVLVFIKHKDDQPHGNWHTLVTFNHVSGCPLNPAKQAQEYAAKLKGQ